MGAEKYHADIRIDGQKDTTKLTVAFRNFANTSKAQRGPQTYKYLIMQHTSINLGRL
jgi:hypothetical protein